MLTKFARLLLLTYNLNYHNWHIYICIHLPVNILNNMVEDPKKQQPRFCSILPVACASNQRPLGTIGVT